MSKINDWEDVPVNEINDWEDVKENPSELESLGRGVLAGASMGFTDEISGGIEALWNKAKGNPTAFGELYKKYRDESRANFKASEEANPKSYMAGQVGGAIATAAVPGMGGATLGKLALQGAAQGLGSSESEDLAGMAKDTAIGAGTGAAIGGAGKALSAGASKLGSAAKNVIEDVATAPMGTPGMQNAGLVARGLDKLGSAGEKVANVAKAADDKIGGMYTKARETAVGDLGNDLLNKGADQVARRTAYAIPVIGQALAAADGAVIGGRVAGTVAKHTPALAQKGATMSIENLPKLMPVLGKYGPVLQNAAQRGGNSLAATHFVLQQTNPEYREQYNKLQDDGNGQQE